MPEGNVTVKAVFQVHSYGDWQIGNSEHWRQCSCGAVSEKTDHADSDQDHKCDVCGKTLMEHTGGKATCRKAAVCEICGEEYGDLNPNNHSGKTDGWQKDNGKHWKVYDCCPAARAEEGDHNSVKDAAKAPACMDTGLTEGAHCGTCGEVLTKQETVKALGHDWGPWTVTTSPTVTAEGVETRTCRNDASHTETRSIPKLTPAPRPDPTPGKTDGKKTDGSKTDSDKTMQSGRTGDMGIGLYAATALLSLTGMAWVSKKRKK